MEKYGVDKSAMAWFNNYLLDRKQRVRVGTQMSTTVMIPTGVPQGSILGPLLFLVMINDLPSVVKNCQITLFADDAQLQFPFRPVNALHAYEQIQTDLNSVARWCSINGLKINPLKSQTIIIGTTQNRKLLSFDSE